MARTSEKQTVLVVDDNEEESTALIRSLERRELDCFYLRASSATEALAQSSSDEIAVAVVDLTLDSELGPESGLSLIKALLKLTYPPRVLVLTGSHDEQLGIKSLQLGAASFLTKPVEGDHLAALVRDALSYTALATKYRTLQSEHSAQTLGTINTKNSLMRSALELGRFAAQSGQNVLIVGETGTGKGVFAQAISQSRGAAKGPFIRCQPGFGGFDLISSELFGHERGAFTGAIESRKGLLEEANRGVLFIDEVDELPNQTQVMLLNALQEGTFRRLGSNKELKSTFHLICASNRPLGELQSGAKLRNDFYHRIAHLVISLPPLRERTEDLEDLAMAFLRRNANDNDLSVFSISSGALDLIREYRWPGNIRELQATISRSAHLAAFRGRQTIREDDLMFDSKQANGAVGSFRAKVQDFEIELIRDALARNGNNQSAAAAALELDRTTLRRILARTK